MFLFLIFLFIGNSEELKIELNKYYKNCDYNGLIESLNLDGFEYLKFVYLLKKGDFTRAEEQDLKGLEKYRKLEIGILNKFYKEKNFDEVIKMAKDYLMIEKKINKKERIGIDGWVAILYSAIIKGDKELVNHMIQKEKIRKGGFSYFIGIYYLKGTVENIPEYGHPDRLAFSKYFNKIINREELISIIGNCYKDLPNWLEINISLINSLP